MIDPRAINHGMMQQVNVRFAGAGVRQQETSN
jgi:hypothetical protein